MSISTAKIAMISIGMDTDLKLTEEKIWSSWFKGMLGDDVYLISVLSCNDWTNTPDRVEPAELDHCLYMKNPGHVPGVCEGLMRGIDYLSKIDYEGPVVLTCPDVIADEGFKNIVNEETFVNDAYVHDWGPGCVATDWILLAPRTWKEFRFPSYVTNLPHRDGEAIPVMQDSVDNKLFYAPDFSTALEQWNKHYMDARGFKVHLTSNASNVGWPPNVGTWMNVGQCKFRIVHSGGDARPTKKHLTERYMSFDRPFRV